MLKRLGIAVAVLGMTVAALPLAAQERPNTRSGFWFNLGVAGGTLGCDDCDGRESGGSAQIALGGTINSRVLLGASSNAWVKEVEGTTLSMSSLTAVVHFYPSATGAFFLTGGLGVGTLKVEDDFFGSASSSGTSAIVGVGYDWRVGKNFSITPFLNGIGGSFDGGKVNFGQLGVGVTWH